MTTWSFGGTALSLYGKVLVINEYLDLPDKRGDNYEISYRHGTIYVPKFYGQRKMTFGFSINESSAERLEGTLDSLRQLLAVRTQQILSCTMEDASVRNAYASVDNPLEVERITNTLAKCAIEFTLTTPFFRGADPIPTNTTTIDASPTLMTVTNTGTFEERDPIITLTGPLSNTVITNTTNGCVLTYTGTIDAGDSVVIQTVNGEYTAVHNILGNVVGNLTHSGSSALMVFDPVDNDLSITDGTATTGTVDVTFYPPFI